MNYTEDKKVLNAKKIISQQADTGPVTKFNKNAVSIPDNSFPEIDPGNDNVEFDHIYAIMERGSESASVARGHAAAIMTGTKAFDLPVSAFVSVTNGETMLTDLGLIMLNANRQKTSQIGFSSDNKPIDRLIRSIKP